MPEAEKDIEKEPQDISHKACLHIHADIFIMESILDHLVAHSYAPFLVAESDPFPHVERRQGELPVQIGINNVPSLGIDMKGLFQVIKKPGVDQRDISKCCQRDQNTVDTPHD